MDQIAAELGMDPLEVRRQELHPAVRRGARDADRRRLRLRRLRQGARQAARAHRPGRGAQGGRGAARARASTAASASARTPRSAATRRRGSSAPAASACRAAAGSPPRCASTPAARRRVYTGSSPHGQGHETGFAQIVADRLGHRPAAGRRHPRRHRHGPVRPGHLRLAHAGRRRRGDGAGRPRRWPTRPRRSSPTSSRPTRPTSSCATAS